MCHARDCRNRGIEGVPHSGESGSLGNPRVISIDGHQDLDSHSRIRSVRANGGVENASVQIVNHCRDQLSKLIVRKGVRRVKQCSRVYRQHPTMLCDLSDRRLTFRVLPTHAQQTTPCMPAYLRTLTQVTLGCRTPCVQAAGQSGAQTSLVS